MGDMADDAIDAGMDEWLDHECDDDCWYDGCPHASGGGAAHYRIPDDQWRARGEPAVLIKNLRTNHLLNILRSISDGRIRRFEEYFPVKWANLKAEARRRGITRVRAGNWKQIGTDRRSADEKYEGFTKIL